MRSEDYKFLYELEDRFWWFVGMRDVAAALLDPFCSPASEIRTVLDAGCGTGGNLSWLRRYAVAENIVGIDLSQHALDFCRAGQFRFLARASVTRLPFDSCQFDLVTSFEVLTQLPRVEDVERALSEMYRVMRPGGVAFIRVPAYQWMHSEHDEELATMRRYYLASLLDLTTQAGFHTLRATYANTTLLPVAAIRRLVLKRLGLARRGADVQPLSPRLQWLNRILAAVLRSEARWLKKPGATLRLGLSAICIVAKPHDH